MINDISVYVHMWHLYRVQILIIYLPTLVRYRYCPRNNYVDMGPSTRTIPPVYHLGPFSLSYPRYFKMMIIKRWFYTVVRYTQTVAYVTYTLCWGRIWGGGVRGGGGRMINGCFPRVNPTFHTGDICNVRLCQLRDFSLSQQYILAPILLCFRPIC